MFYQGDISGDFPDIKTTHPSFGFDFGYKPGKIFSFSIGYTFGKLSGADSLVPGKEERNFHFFTTIHDFQLMSSSDLNAIRRKIWPRKTVDRSDFEPGFTGPDFLLGLGFMKFNPKGEKDGEIYQLQKLGTEGQHISAGDYPEPYKLWVFNIKYGISVGYNFGRQFNLEVQMIYTKTLTDYLDDVSGEYPDYNDLMKSENGETTAYFTYGGRDGSLTEKGRLRGNPDSNDSYSSLVFKLTYIFGRSEFQRLMNL